MSRLGREAPVGFGALGLSLTVIYALQLNPIISALCTGVTALVAIIGMILGPYLHRPTPVLPWRLLTVASVLFLVGVMVRPWSADQTGSGQWTADSFTLSG